MTEEHSTREWIRHMAQYCAQYQADGIDARIPPESTHPSAIEARKYTALARAAKTELEGARYIQDALAHWKDFELFDGAIKSKKFKPAGRGAGLFRNKIASLLKKNPALKNPELWSAVADKPPRGWSAFDNRLGKYLEGRTPDEHIVQRRFFNICGEERKKLKQ